MRYTTLRRIGQRGLAVVLGASMLAVPAAARAQTGISIWAGAGGASTDGTVTFGKDAKQLGVQLAVPILPVAVRADALLLGSDFTTDALSYDLNAVFQMRLPVIQPYGIIGRGRYAQSPTTKVTGWNYGVGARVGLGRFGIFGEVRKHQEIHRTISVIGVTF
jgi:hypothetical protein